MAERNPNIYTVPPGADFVAVLARQLLAETESDPLALSSMLVLLPTRRAVRALRNSFLAQSGGKPLLLPRMRPLGDVDEDDPGLADEPSPDLPPAIPELRRRLLLARLIMALGSARGGATTVEQAVPLAEELGHLLDQVQIEELNFDRLATLVPDDFAAHWQITLKFLELLTKRWPRILKEEGALDPAERRSKLLSAQAEAWKAQPPDFPIIAAGSTGTWPATRRLLEVVARLPNGRLVLPGLDREMDKESRAALDETHPQWGLFRLLDALGVEPRSVPLWPGTLLSPRARLIAEAMRPAATTEIWRTLDPATVRHGLNGVTRIDCPGPREEAAVIALRLRAALETADRTAALVTPDRELARRVAAELRRFDIEIDNSAGQELALTEPGAFLLLTATMVAEAFAPHPALAALKHPLAAGGLSAGEFRRRVRRVELTTLRGPRPAPGIRGSRALLSDRDKAWLDPWLDKLEAMATPFMKVMARLTPLQALLEAHVDFAESLAADDTTEGASRLWAGDAGAAASSFVLELAESCQRVDTLSPISGPTYPGLLRVLMKGRTVRPAWGRHPRLRIWGPLEARLQRADLMILGGMNEGTWPTEVLADPWMSRPMRAQFGLPLPERRIGLAAHDFAQAFCAPEIVVTRSVRIAGTPTVPSRWLMRLDAVLAACGLDKLPRDARWLAWHSELDRPTVAASRPRPPAPQPPLEARPRELPVTDIELWRRDPYSLYAKRILKLRALEPIDAAPDAADYGTAIHRALDRFVAAHPMGALPPDARRRLLAMGEAAFGENMDRPGVWAFWWPRFERVASWFLTQEIERRHLLARAWSEVPGFLVVEAPGGPFTLTAKADRIDRQSDGGLVVFDYKTGTVPSAREVTAGYAPQLPLEGAIAVAGGFEGVPAGELLALLYWRLSGGAIAGQERAATREPPTDLARAALEGLRAMVASFDDPATPYEARPHPDHVPRYSDYLHLARVKEWSGGDAEESE